MAKGKSFRTDDGMIIDLTTDGAKAAQFSFLPENIYPLEHLHRCVRTLWPQCGDQMLAYFAEQGAMEQIYGTFPEVRNIAKKGMKNGKLTSNGLVQARKAAQQMGYFAKPICDLSVLSWMSGERECAAWQKALARLVASRFMEESDREEMFGSCAANLDVFLSRYAFSDEWVNDVLIMGSYANRAEYALTLLKGMREAISEASIDSIEDAERWLSIALANFRNCRRAVRDATREIRGRLRFMADKAAFFGSPAALADFIRSDALDWLGMNVPKSGLTPEKALALLKSLVPPIPDVDIATAAGECEKIASGAIAEKDSFLLSFVVPHLLGENPEIPEDAECPYSWSFVNRLMKGTYRLPDDGEDDDAAKAAEFEPAEPEAVNQETPETGSTEQESAAFEPAESEPTGQETVNQEAVESEPDGQEAASEPAESELAEPEAVNQETVEVDEAAESEGGIPVEEAPVKEGPQRRPADHAAALEDAFSGAARIHPWNNMLTPDEAKLLGNAGGLSRILKSGRERRTQGSNGGRDFEFPNDSDHVHLWLEKLEKDAFGELSLVSEHYGYRPKLTSLIVRSSTGQEFEPEEVGISLDMPWLAAGCLLMGAFHRPEKEWAKAVSVLRPSLHRIDRFLSLLETFLFSDRAFSVFARTDLGEEARLFIDKAQMISINYEPAEKILRKLFGYGSEYADGLLACAEGKADPEYYLDLLGNGRKKGEIVDSFKFRGRTVMAGARQKLFGMIDECVELFRRFRAMNESVSEVNAALSAIYPDVRAEASEDPYGRFFLRRADDAAQGRLPLFAPVDPACGHVFLAAGMDIGGSPDDAARAARICAETGRTNHAERFCEAWPDKADGSKSAIARWRDLAKRLISSAGRSAAMSFLLGKIGFPRLAHARAVLGYASRLDAFDGLAMAADFVAEHGISEGIPKNAPAKQAETFMSAWDLIGSGLMPASAGDPIFCEKAPNFWSATAYEGGSRFPGVSGRFAFVKGKGDYSSRSFARLRIALSGRDLPAVIFFDGTLSASSRREMMMQEWRSLPLVYDANTHKFMDGMLSLSGDWIGTAAEFHVIPEAAVPILLGFRERDPELCEELGAFIPPSRNFSLHGLLDLVLAFGETCPDQEEAALGLLEYGDMDYGEIAEAIGKNARKTLSGLAGEDEISFMEGELC